MLPFVKAIVERATPEWKKTKQALQKRLTNSVNGAISAHHVFVVNWCHQDVHPLVDGHEGIGTVELGFSSIPRKFGSHNKSKSLNEIDVLLEDSHFAVLGDPGAGKTTTLRRLATMVSANGEFSDHDQFRFVVLVVCRSVQWSANRDLYDVLGDIIGVTEKLARDLDNPELAIRTLLNNGALVVIDGLDEVPESQRSQLEQDIITLGMHLDKGKIIVSCRSGAYETRLTGFKTAEILPLSDAQIREIVTEFLGNEAPGFFAALLRPDHPSRDLANRPLFLGQLVNIYQRRAKIPDRPIDLYDAIVHLVLEKWDLSRDVKRQSRYANFTVDDKKRFLAELALHLIANDMIRFSRVDLVEAYGTLAEQYGLPRADAMAVVKEIESHTGLIVDSGDGFEFSHLSLQEFLAADALLRGPRTNFIDWWERFAEEAAIALALASDANGVLGELVEQLTPHVEARPLQVFLHRLGQEQPRFKRDKRLGDRILYLLFKAHTKNVITGERLAGSGAIKGSVLDALRDHRLKKTGSDVMISDFASVKAASVINVDREVLRAVVGNETMRELLGN